MPAIKAARISIEEALINATFAQASFSSKVEVDAMIKEETKLFRMTWIIPNLMEAIKDIDPCPTCKGRGKAYQGDEITGSLVDCKPCKTTGIRGGLSFDPYALCNRMVSK